MKALHQRGVVVDVAIGGGVLQQGAEVVAKVTELLLVGYHDHDAQWFGTGPQHVQGLRMAVAGCEEGVGGLVLAQPFAKGHGLGGGRGFVEQRRIGDRQPGQVADQGLEVEQGFQAALGDFWLIRRVGGVPGWILQQVAQNRRGRMAIVVALADIRLEQLVVLGDGLDIGEGLSFALAAGQLQDAGALDRFRYHGGAQRLQGVEPQGVEHGQLVGGARADVPGDEFVGGVQGGAQGHEGLLSLGC
jgi:hypothetical protein